MSEIAATLPQDLPSAQQEIVQLRSALTSRARIDQAKGVIMSWLCCDENEAFDELVRASQHHNRKLRELAGEIVDLSSECAPDRDSFLAQYFGEQHSA